MSIYVSPAMRRLAIRRMSGGPWTSHIPFAYDLVAALKPRLVVDIGASPDLSCFAFCQSIQEHELDALCYTVGDWDGPALDDISAYNRRLYVGFSYLMQMPLHQALGHFSDESIGLLHFDCVGRIEGSEDFFESWYSKLRPGGVFLIHGTAVPGSDGASVWRDRAAYGGFGFEHGRGLGVIRKPDPNGQLAPGLMQLLFGEDEADRNQLSSLYAHIAQYHEMDHALDPNQFTLIKRQRNES